MNNLELLHKVYEQISQELEIVYTHAALHYETGDFEEYQKCIEKIAKIADDLGIKTEQVYLVLKLTNENNN